MRKRAIGWLKIGLPVLLVAWLLFRTWRKDSDHLRIIFENPRNPSLLAASFVVILFAIVLSFVRWHLLLRILNIPIRLRDTLRLSFLGFLLNFISPGGVGGDLFKAVFIWREQPKYRAEATATILVDRACGMYALLLVTSAGLWLSNLAANNKVIASIAYFTYVLTIVGTIGVLVVMTPQLVQSSLAERTTQLPKIGPALRRLIYAVRQYQNSKPRLFLVGLVSLSVHILVAIGIYCASRGLYYDIPTLAEHFVISPLACAVGTLPLTPGGLGTFELAMDELYSLVSPSGDKGPGLVVALCFRLSSIIAAGIGVYFYWLRHREVMQVLHEAEQQAGELV